MHLFDSLSDAELFIYPSYIIVSGIAMVLLISFPVSLHMEPEPSGEEFNFIVLILSLPLVYRDSRSLNCFCAYSYDL